MQIGGKAVPAVALVCVLAAPAMAQDASATLSGDEIKTAIAGSTLRATVLGGDVYEEYFAPDGSMTMAGDDGVYDGIWYIVGDTICMELSFPSNDGCWSVTVDGDAITLIGPDGEVDYEKTIIARDGEAAEP